MTLADLFARAGIARHAQWLWFEGARLTSQTLTLRASDETETVLRCYQDQLKEALPGLQITVVVEKPPVEFDGPRSVAKSKQKAYTAWREAEPQRLKGAE